MTTEQHILINGAIEAIRLARQRLDEAMYHLEPKMTDKEFKKVRDAYNLICKANDKL